MQGVMRVHANEGFTKNPVTSECHRRGRTAVSASRKPGIHYRPGSCIRREKMWKNVQGFEKFLKWWRHCASEGKRWKMQVEVKKKHM